MVVVLIGAFVFCRRQYKGLDAMAGVSYPVHDLDVNVYSACSLAAASCRPICSRRTIGEEMVDVICAGRTLSRTWMIPRRYRECACFRQAIRRPCSPVSGDLDESAQVAINCFFCRFEFSVKYPWKWRKLVVIFYQ